MRRPATGQKRSALGAWVVALTVLVLGGAGIVRHWYGVSEARTEALEVARQASERGGLGDLDAAIAVLGASLERRDDPEVASHWLMLRVLRWVECGVHPGQWPPQEWPSVPRARAAALLAALMDSVARETALAGPGPDPDAEYARWIEGARLLFDLSPSPAALEAYLAVDDPPASASAAQLRMRGWLLQRSGQAEQWLELVQQARPRFRQHSGLAADEALAMAELPGRVANAAELAGALLEMDRERLAPFDRARLEVAMGVLSVEAGDPEGGLRRISEAWDAMPPWDYVSRRAALEIALRAGRGALAESWLTNLPLTVGERGLYRAWVALARGDVIGCLTRAATLDQSDGRVAYIQALALVEQRRFAEAEPWLRRAQRLMPGRAELEVAAERAAIARGEASLAVAKLRSLVEHEAWAARAWTGLGEGLVALGRWSDADDALRRAVRAEPRPAEALYLRAHVLAKLEPARAWVGDVAARRLRLLQQAVEVNGYLPRYQEALAMHHFHVGELARAAELWAKVVDLSGVDPQVPLRLVEVAARKVPGLEPEWERWLKRAEELGASRASRLVARARWQVHAGTRRGLRNAHRDVARAVDEVPDDPELRLAYVDLCERIGLRDEAELALRRGLQTLPETVHGRLYLRWAQLEAWEGRRARAASHARLGLERMIAEQRPHHEILDAAKFAMRLWVKEGRILVARAMARLATEAVPTSAELWTRRAEIEDRIPGGHRGACESAARARDLGATDVGVDCRR